VLDLLWLDVMLYETLALSLPCGLVEWENIVFSWRKLFLYDVHDSRSCKLIEDSK
jgi:hypothetical protein